MRNHHISISRSSPLYLFRSSIHFGTDIDATEPSKSNPNAEFLADMRRRISQTSVFDVAFQFVHRDGMALGDHDTEVAEGSKEE